MTWNINDVPEQDGHLAIVSGANTGQGYDTALALAGKDWSNLLTRQIALATKVCKFLRELRHQFLILLAYDTYPHFEEAKP